MDYYHEVSNQSRKHTLQLYNLGLIVKRSGLARMDAKKWKNKSVSLLPFFFFRLEQDLQPQLSND